MADSSPTGSAGSSESRQPPRPHHLLLAGLGLVLVVVLFFVLNRDGPEAADGDEGIPPAAAALPEPAFVGSQQCAACHAEQFTEWKDSTHGLAGGPATRESVIGDFEDTTLRFKDAVVKLSIEEGDTYWFEVTLEGYEPKRYRADYVVGRGLMHGGGGQSYFSRFPDGTVRLLPFEWSNQDGPWFIQTKSRKWQPVSEEISLLESTSWPPYRVLGDSANFAQNCQGCHGSQIETVYDPEEQKHRTNFTTLAINCESCHGPGSRHIALMSRPDREDNPDIGLQSLATLDKEASVQACLQCHATKRKLGSGQHLPGTPMEEHYTTRLHTWFSEEFHPDGRIASFLYQKNHYFSDCYINGSMTCVDCHDPHSLHYRDINGRKLVGKFDDRQCTSCHAAKAEDISAHTFHRPESEGSRCTSCHMPFLRHPSIGPHVGFDRSDHTIASPRPAFDASLGLDNACSQCHRDRSVEELERQVQEWYGPLKPHKPIVEALAEAGEPDDADEAAAKLLQPGFPIAEVTGLSHYLHDFTEPDEKPSAETLERFRRYADSTNLDVQALGMTALHLVQGVDRTIEEELANLAEATGDRAEAIKRRRGLALHLLADSWLEDGKAPQAAIAYRKALEVDENDALAHLGLAKTLFARQRAEEGLPHLRQAARHAPYNTNIQNNVGVYLAQAGLFAEAIPHFERVVEMHRDEVDLLYNLALTRLKANELGKAAEEFRRVVELDPRNANAHLSLGRIAIQQGRINDALACFAHAEEAQPDDVYILMQLAGIYRNGKRIPKALELLKRAEQLAATEFGPADPRTLDIRRRIRILESTTP